MQLEKAMSANATGLVSEFSRLANDIPYERKGVLFSEMLFVRSVLAELKPGRILESGRAGGQSTHLLAVCFPDLEILSVERDPASPDVEVAAKRLAGFDNVTLLFGDAMKWLPQVLKRGDAVLIDGPKGLRAIRLALQLLRTALPVAVFVHDCGHGTEERAFLERHLPQTLYSDAPSFVERYAFLDGRCSEVDPEVVCPLPDEKRSYGPTFACLIPERGIDYGRLLRRLAITSIVHRADRARRRWS